MQPPTNSRLGTGTTDTGSAKTRASSVKARALTGNTTVRMAKVGKAGKADKAGEPKKRKERKRKSKNRKSGQDSPIMKKVKQKTEQIKKTDSKELKRHLYIFKSLTKKAKNRDIVLKKAPITIYKTIRLLFKLMKKGAIPLNNVQRNRLKPWINFIRKNATGKDSTVKSNVVQNGDGLSSILKTILPIIAPILSMII